MNIPRTRRRTPEHTRFRKIGARPSAHAPTRPLRPVSSVVSRGSLGRRERSCLLSSALRPQATVRNGACARAATPPTNADDYFLHLPFFSFYYLPFA